MAVGDSVQGPSILDDAYVQECGVRDTALGPALYIRIRRYDDLPMSWDDIWAVFSDRYPNQWAVEVFPPEYALVNEVNAYHLFVVYEEPAGLNIMR